MGWSVVTRGLPFAISSVTTLGLARVLPVAEYATYALAVALVTILAALLDAGVSTATARLLAECRYPTSLVLRSSAVVWFVSTATGALLLVVALDSIGAFLRTEALTPVAPAIVALLALRTAQLRMQRIAEGLRYNDAIGRSSVLYSWLSPILAVALPLLTSATAGFALAGVASGRAVLLYASATALNRARRSETRGGSTHPVNAYALTSPRFRVAIRRLLRYAAPQAGIGTSLTIYNNAGILLVQRLLGTESSASFALAMRVIEVLVVPGAGFAAAVGPSFARSPVDAWRSTRRLLAKLLTFYVPLLAAIALLLGALLPVLVGPKYASVSTLVLWLYPYLLFQVIATLLGSVLDYLGTTMRRTAVVVFTTVLYLGTAWLTFPHLDVIGAAIVTSITYAPLVVAYAYLIAVHRASDRHPGSRRIATELASAPK